MFEFKILHLAIVFAVATADNRFCQSSSYSGRSYNYDVVTKIPGSRKFSQLSFVGTHHSLSHLVEEPEFQHQDWTIDQQLESGVRVLHFDVKSESDDLSIYVKNQKLSLKFGVSILPILNKFLENHPEEFVFVYFTEKGAAQGSNCNSLRKIKASSSGERINIGWTVSELIRRYRGKILIAGDKSFSGCSNVLEGECSTDKFKPLNDVDDIDRKWQAIEDLQEETIDMKNDCFIQKLFIENAKSKKAISREGGFETSNGECAEPLNQRMADNLEDQSTAFVIFLGDYMIQKLINKVAETNYPII